MAPVAASSSVAITKARIIISAKSFRVSKGTI
jgi:hypothetical protein